MVHSLIPAARRRARTPTGLAAMAVVLAMVLLWWLFSGNGPQGLPGNDSRFAVPDTDAGAAPGGAGGPAGPPAPASANGVRIDGFVREGGKQIALNYTTGVPGCSGTIDTPEVLETSAAVTVTLTLRPPERPSEEPCPGLAVLRTLRVDLDSELADRSVLDGSFAQPVRVRETQRTNE